ncbi:MAG TPA: PilZ domain-containing protein [Erythrobacter sp.]|nr:PilZ domain-containing protein [Erythrobacter sp.]
MPPLAATTSPADSIDNFGRRAAARLRLSIPARIVTVYETQSCILLDLSQTGARIGTANPMALGDGGFLVVGPIEVFGEAVRRMLGHGGGVNGIAFDDRLLHDDVLAVRHHAETFRQIERETLRDQVRLWVTGR